MIHRPLIGNGEVPSGAVVALVPNPLNVILVAYSRSCSCVSQKHFHGLRQTDLPDKLANGFSLQQFSLAVKLKPADGNRF